MGYIYKITNDINNKVYIGQTINSIAQRWSIHKQMSKKLPNLLYKAIRKYGIEHFSICEIEHCDNNKLNEREIYWIKYYNSYHNGYNMTPGGSCSNGAPNKYREQIISLYKEHPNYTYREIAELIGCSEATVRRNLSHANTGKDTSSYKGVSVLQYDLEGNFIQEFSSARQAAMAVNNGNPNGCSSIRKVCKNYDNFKTAYGYYWKFKEN